MSKVRYESVMTADRNLAPAEHEEFDSPYTIPNDRYAALTTILHDVGGEPDYPQALYGKGEEDWEMNTYLTCECLAWRGAWNAEMRRRAENDLGKTQYYGFPYYGRWITGAARVLVHKGLITTDELGDKIDEIRARLEKK
ncbi:SH3-like domain-containing protein [Nonomuraea wenchangensis]|uniref:Nitrile hydratase beta subunit n=1 Tax=Nonomuraea wenchangensis TaxID=568860 RepID=A0A1I0KIH1_9ACTN|nr:Nitrile hydratase beta subunit [Nonomuraea wenchangensis]